ncbi:MAG: MBL fold metallo-hydrolase [Desulfosalsimonadaceae bacterium]
MVRFTSFASGSSGNLYTVSDGQTTIMLECGIPWRKVRERMNFSTSGIEGVLITHGHGDHCKGAKDAARAGLDVYASTETLAAAQVSGHRAYTVEAGKVFVIGSWHVLPFSTVHDAPGSLGYYMVNFDGEAFLYLTDSAYSPVRFKRLDVVAIEANYDPGILSENIARGALPAVVGHRVRRSHFSIDSVVELLKANDLSKCREIHLLHLSSGNSDEELMRRRVQEATGIATYIAAA